MIDRQNPRPQWRCPKCGHRFVTRNLSHSCGRFRLADHFRRSIPSVRRAFTKLVKVARQSGPVTVYAQKTRIVLQARVRFINVVVHREWLDAGVWLRRKARHPDLVRVESYGSLGYGNHFRLSQPGDIDSALGAIIRESYNSVKQPQ